MRHVRRHRLDVRVTPRDEARVDEQIVGAAVHVREGAAVPVEPLDVEHEAQGIAGVQQALGESRRSLAVALVAEVGMHGLGSVDPDEPHARAVTQLQRVAVDDASQSRRALLRRRPRRDAGDEQGGEQCRHHGEGSTR